MSLTAEVFNVFNYRNFTGFNTNVGNFNNTGGITANPNFGIPTAVLNDLTRFVDSVKTGQVHVQAYSSSSTAGTKR